MKNCLYLLLITLIISCNIPEDKRARRSSRNTELDSDIYSRNRTSYIPPVKAGSSETSSDSKVESSTSSDSSDEKNSNSFPEMKSNCTFSKNGVSEFNGGLSHHLGSYYNLCQLKSNNNIIYFQLKTPVTDQSVCFIPIHNYGDKSVYIGEPRCRYITSSTTIYKIELLNNRSGYSNIGITGVMIMKNKDTLFDPPFRPGIKVKLPNAYIFCSEYLDQYGDSSYCVAFRKKGEYLYKQF